MRIHLSKPNGQREGPFTIEEINRDLAARKYSDTDYWAWYEGLDAWVPLHTVPGVTVNTEAPVEMASSEASPDVEQSSGEGGASAPDTRRTPAAAEQVFSGMPVEALEQIFVFTTGEGPAVMHSPATKVMLQTVTGADITAMRDKVPRDVFGRCDIAQRLRKESNVPTSGWKAMSALKPELVQRARGGAYRICVRTFSIETNDLVALFLFYNKEKLLQG
jgi:hypothetical protein